MSWGITSERELVRRFLERARLAEDAGLREWVEALRAIPYGRPSIRTARGVLEEWRGTCSSKHALLLALLRARPEREGALVHRVYRATREGMSGWGAAVMAAIPPEGLVDVHTYAEVMLGGRRVRLDVTFPGAPWDGCSDMELACGPGEDHPAGADPAATKAALVARYCEPSVREPFIAALASRCRSVD